MATTYLTRTATANNNSVGKWTFSCWVKRLSLGADTNLISFYSTGAYRSALRFDSDDKLRFYEFYNSSTIVAKVTNRKFRDTSAWYHIVLAVDKTVSSPSTQIYVNGVATTSWSTDTDYSQNQNGKFNDAEPIYINAESSVGGGSNVRDICMSHVHFVDGTAYAASTFGETDSVTGEWKINTSPSVTYGTNGFFILKDGNSVTDQSGNGNNFTVAAGTLTNTEDNPSNVFATLNRLNKQTGSQTYAHGMTTVGGDGGPRFYNATTLGANAGKFYCEAKIGAINSGDAALIHLGITANAQESNRTNTEPGNNAYSYGLRRSDGVIMYNSGGNSYGTSYTTNDIIGIAMDLDNNKLYFSKNGTFMNSANPSAGTGGFSITDVDSISTTNGFYHFAVGDDSGTQGGGNIINFNFGNGFFGTTAISSEGTNASNLGKFEYDVPTGFTALCTKGLNE